MEEGCINCGSIDFVLESGFYYCSECGTKTDVC